MEEYNPKYLTYLLESPGESSKADYKVAIGFKENEEFSVKLIKQMIGMANNQGGYLVIGFNDSNFSFDANLDDKIVKSYDTTRLSQSANSYTTNQESISLTVHKKRHDGKTFPIIRVVPFINYPFFTSDKDERKNSGRIMKKGCIYFRDEEAKTVAIANEAQMKKIIDRCVKNQQHSILREFKDLLEMATAGGLSPGEEKAMKVQDEGWILEARNRSKE